MAGYCIHRVHCKTLNVLEFTNLLNTESTSSTNMAIREGAKPQTPARTQHRHTYLYLAPGNLRPSAARYCTCSSFPATLGRRPRAGACFIWPYSVFFEAKSTLSPLPGSIYQSSPPGLIADYLLLFQQWTWLFPGPYRASRASYRHAMQKRIDVPPLGPRASRPPISISHLLIRSWQSSQALLLMSAPAGWVYDAPSNRVR